MGQKDSNGRAQESARVEMNVMIHVAWDGGFSVFDRIYYRHRARKHKKLF